MDMAKTMGIIEIHITGTLLMIDTIDTDQGHTQMMDMVMTIGIDQDLKTTTK